MICPAFPKTKLILNQQPFIQPEFYPIQSYRSKFKATPKPMSKNHEEAKKKPVTFRPIIRKNTTPSSVNSENVEKKKPVTFKPLIRKKTTTTTKPTTTEAVSQSSQQTNDLPEMVTDKEVTKQETHPGTTATPQPLASSSAKPIPDSASSVPQKEASNYQLIVSDKAEDEMPSKSEETTDSPESNMEEASTSQRHSTQQVN